MNELEAWRWLRKQYGVTVYMSQEGIFVTYPSSAPGEVYHDKSIIGVVKKCQAAKSK